MKILIVRFSSIGDVVLTTPVVRCIKLQKNATIHYITKNAFLPLLETNPYIDKIFCIDKKIKEVINDLKAEKYDYVIDLHKNIRTLSLKNQLGVKSFSFPKLHIKKWLLTALKVDLLPAIHVVDRYFEAVKKINVFSDLKPCDLYLTNADNVDLSEHGLTEKKYLAVAMGAQFGTKQIPIELLVKILRNQTLPIVLLGGPMDVPRSNQLIALLKSQKLINFCGNISIRQSAFVLKNASVLLTADTGLMHIASCFETPCVSVWGNTVPSLGMYTYAPLNFESFKIHEVNNLKCRPCSKIGHSSCPKRHFNCMNQQDSKAISEDLFDFQTK